MLIVRTCMYVCIHIKPSSQVNMPKPRGYLVTNTFFTLVTFVINLWAAICILRKERTKVNTLIVCDCIINMASSVQTSILQSPWILLNSSTTCLVNTFLLHLLNTWNRLVPVAIAGFRYVMVCHAVYVHNHGGEKKVSPGYFKVLQRG